MGIFQIKYIAEYTIGLNTKNKLNIMKRKKERKKGRKKKGRKKKGRKKKGGKKKGGRKRKLIKGN